MAKAPAYESPEKRAKRLEREQQCAAFDAMVKRRPLKPPPGRPPVRVATASELALEADRRLGLVGDGAKFLDEASE